MRRPASAADGDGLPAADASALNEPSNGRAGAAGIQPLAGTEAARIGTSPDLGEEANGGVDGRAAGLAQQEAGQ